MEWYFGVWWMDLESWDWSAISALECNILCSEKTTSKWPKTWLCYVAWYIIVRHLLEINFQPIFSWVSYFFYFWQILLLYRGVTGSMTLPASFFNSFEKSYKCKIKIGNYTVAELDFVSPSQQVTVNYFCLIEVKVTHIITSLRLHINS